MAEWTFTETPEPGLNELVGKEVEIIWTDEADWYYFKVLAIDKPFIKLQGIDSPEGDRHSTKAFWTTLNKVDVIEEIIYD